VPVLFLTFINERERFRQSLRSDVLDWNFRPIGVGYLHTVMTAEPDVQLISRYLGGDVAALETLVTRHLRPVYAYVFRQVGNVQDAEDITQEVFVRVWKNLKKFDSQKSFLPWVFRIARNASVDFLRRKKTVPFCAFENEAGENVLVETLADPAPLPAELFDQHNLTQRLATAIAGLPSAHREVLFLHYNDHFSFQEIAELTGEGINTVKSRHYRAVVALRKRLV